MKTRADVIKSCADIVFQSHSLYMQLALVESDIKFLTPKLLKLCCPYSEGDVVELGAGKQTTLRSIKINKLALRSPTANSLKSACCYIYASEKETDYLEIIGSYQSDYYRIIEKLGILTVEDLINGNCKEEVKSVFNLWKTACEKEYAIDREIMALSRKLAEAACPFNKDDCIKIPYARTKHWRYCQLLNCNAIELRPVFMAPENFPDLTFYTIRGGALYENSDGTKSLMDAGVVFSSWYANPESKRHSARAYERVSLPTNRHSPTWKEVMKEIAKR